MINDDGKPINDDDNNPTVLGPLQWAKNQPWWAVAHAAAKEGQVIVIHVPDLPFQGSHLRLRSRNGKILVYRCSAPFWHVSTSAPVYLANEIEASVKLERVEHHRHHHPVVGEA